MLGVFFTLDGLRSVPQELYIDESKIGPGMPNYRLPIKDKITNEFFVMRLSYPVSPRIDHREYEFSKFVEWFDGSKVAYFCETHSQKKESE